MSRLLTISALIFACCQLTLAQEGKSQPVARLITSLAPVTSASTPAAAVEPNDIEKRAFEQTNVVRVQNGLPPLAWAGDVSRMARIHSESIASPAVLFARDTRRFALARQSTRSRHSAICRPW